MFAFLTVKGRSFARRIFVSITIVETVQPLREIFARDSAYNSCRDPAIFVACARPHSSSKERKREARPFFRERSIQGFFNIG